MLGGGCVLFWYKHLDFAAQFNSIANNMLFVHPYDERTFHLHFFRFIYHFDLFEFFAVLSDNFKVRFKI